MRLLYRIEVQKRERTVVKKIIFELKNKIEINLNEIESYYDSIHMFLLQVRILDTVNLKNFQIKQWLYDNRYTITLIEEIIEKIQRKTNRFQKT